ncbi:ubiquitin C-terminal hydrolase of the cysteine proteinase fold [Cryptosporidium ubiquitum]|uniref:Ubiquitin carboxyl-terminal hydrolase n=1 Tax=Cryptosporidium ubiquitum TaxID=857276 RepID=A0A1J4MIA4_9CRYT|nr:ubiquitin C-terminal hydrolase of the cysteine proteinase fold [Cryptosporidium ubiquitum]OII73751.1 ubiquitin C-terminal hydrolase of the cysteine proteinase fold [Cryptosporidium ubiquitum]
MNNKNKIWKPLISDPKILEEYSTGLGVKSQICFVDIYSTEETELDIYDINPISLIILVPTNDEKICKKRDEFGYKITGYQKVWFMKQYIQNSCGAVALLHSILNNNLIELEEESIAKTLLNLKSESNDLAKERGLYLINNKKIEYLHEKLSSRDISNDCFVTEFHYISFVNINGNIIELDGRLPCPISHGVFKSGEFLKSSLKVIKEKFIYPLGIDGKVAIIAVCIK